MIKVEDLNYKYSKMSKEALKGISFSVSKGEVFGFLGPSGAGKTTTQKIIIGLLRSYIGSVRVLEKERKEWGNDFFERIGVAFEFPNLYLKFSALENLKLICSYYKSKTREPRELLERLGLLADADKRVENFSKGMKMRLNFIRSIIHNPEIIFLDEPTSGLDPVNAKIMKDMIIEMKSEGKTVFITTHNMTVADQLCDRVAFIDNGEIKLIDTPKNLKKQYGNKMVSVEYLKNGEEACEAFEMKGLERNNGFIQLLEAKEILSIHSQEATLEDIFIKVTGRDLV